MGYFRLSDMGHDHFLNSTGRQEHFLNSTGRHEHFLNSTGRHWAFLNSTCKIRTPPPPVKGPDIAGTNWYSRLNYSSYGYLLLDGISAHMFYRFHWKVYVCIQSSYPRPNKTKSCQYFRQSARHMKSTMQV